MTAEDCSVLEPESPRPKGSRSQVIPTKRKPQPAWNGHPQWLHSSQTLLGLTHRPLSCTKLLPKMSLLFSLRITWIVPNVLNVPPHTWPWAASVKRPIVPEPSDSSQALLLRHPPSRELSAPFRPLTYLPSKPPADQKDREGCCILFFTPRDSVSIMSLLCGDSSMLNECTPRVYVFLHLLP